MRVLLISPNREQLPDPVFPLGLAYVATAARDRGHDVKILDLCFADNAAEAIRGTIAEFRPEAIALSIRNVDDVAYPRRHSFIDEYREAVHMIRQCSAAPVILGGSGFTILPQDFMRELGADFGIAGEGENTFPVLLERILKGTISSSAPLAKRIFSSSQRIGNLDLIPAGRSGLDAEAYYNLGGMLNVQTKRGCPFNCIYCTYPKIEGKRVRTRNPARVADEIESVVRSHGVRHFFFVDSIFNYPKAHAEAVCRELIGRKTDIRWSCYGHPAYMDIRLARLMAEAGCTGVEFGVDALSDATLAALGKSFDFRAVKRAADVCRTAGLRFCLFLFAGAPGEDYDAVFRNLDRLEELDPDAAVVMAGIRVFPGTGIERIAKKELKLPMTGLDPVFYISPDVVDGLEDIRERVSCHRRWIMPGYEINIHPRLQRRLRQKGIKGALWEELAKR